MSFTPENAAIKLSPEQEKTISQMPSDQISEYLKNLAVEQNLAVRDWDKTQFIYPTIPAQSKVTKTVTVDGKAFTVEGATEADALQKQNELLQQLMSGTTPATATSGAAVERNVEQRAANSAEDQKYVQSWADATQQFLHSDAGADWPGGERNKEILGRVLADNDLLDAEDKVAALAAAYQHAKMYHLLEANPDVERQREESKRKQGEELAKSLSGASSLEEIRTAVHRSLGLSGNYISQG